MDDQNMNDMFDDEPIQQINNQSQEEQIQLLSYKPYFDEQLFVQNDVQEEFCYYIKNTKVKDYPIICIHGAGFSALSFCQLAYLMQKDSSIIAIDLRGHGFSTKQRPYSFSQLTHDLQQIIPKILDRHAEKKLEKYNIVFIGHSLGGSIITGLQSDRIEPQCLCVIDIAEHIAIRSLKNMDQIERLINRKYKNYNQVIQIYSNNRILKNKKAIWLQLKGLINEQTMMPNFDFNGSEVYWQNWFVGFNQRFLQSKAYKYLFVSNYQNLDSEQEIAYSQGILAMDIMGNLHNIHEEYPEDFCYNLQRFLRRLHLTQQTYDQPMDFEKPLFDWEKPIEKDELKKMNDEAWEQCIRLSQQQTQK